MKVVRNRLSVDLVVCLLVSVLLAGAAQAGILGIFGIGGSKKKAPSTPKQSLVIFPFDQEGVQTAPKGFGVFVASDLRTMLSSSERYSPVLFRSQLPPIQRANQDGTLKVDDVPYGVDNSGNLENTSFADSQSRQKTLKLAQLLCTDYYIVGAVDEVNIQRDRKYADITLRAELFDGRTGKLLKTFLITGQSPDSMVSGDEDELRDVAKGVAVTKLIAEIAGSTGTPAPAPTTGPVVSNSPAVEAPQPATGSTEPSAPVNRPPDKPSK